MKQKLAHSLASPPWLERIPRHFILPFTSDKRELQLEAEKPYSPRLVFIKRRNEAGLKQNGRRRRGIECL